MMYFPALPNVSRSGQSPHYRLVRMFELAPNNKGTNVSAGITGRSRGRLLYYSGITRNDCAATRANLVEGKWTSVEMRSDTNGYQAWNYSGIGQVQVAAHPA